MSGLRNSMEPRRPCWAGWKSQGLCGDQQGRRRVHRWGPCQPLSGLEECLHTKPWPFRRHDCRSGEQIYLALLMPTLKSLLSSQASLPSIVGIPPKPHIAVKVQLREHPNINIKCFSNNSNAYFWIIFPRTIDNRNSQPFHTKPHLLFGITWIKWDPKWCPQDTSEYLSDWF